MEQQKPVEKFWYDVEIAHMARLAIFAHDEDNAKLLADLYCFENQIYGPPLGQPPSALMTAKPHDSTMEDSLETMREARKSVAPHVILQHLDTTKCSNPFGQHTRRVA